MTFDTLNKVYIIPTDDTEESMEFLKKMIAKIKPRYLFTHLLRKDGGLANASVTIVETEDFKNFNLLEWNDTSYQNSN